MATEVPKVASQQQPAEYKEKPRRTERVESIIDLRHKGVRTGVAAGGLLALVGLAAVLLN
ncbi:hypothetical protein [Pseudoduganella sp. RAF53_2]|jgi:hypothetical protein|uniref:hypothetical protein n=1 Tax=unclassified Pseudoduganella TaxID=2637179 RepID=UPI003F9C7C3B